MTLNSAIINTKCEAVKALAVQMERSVTFKEKVKAAGALLRAMDELSGEVDKIVEQYVAIPGGDS